MKQCSTCEYIDCDTFDEPCCQCDDYDLHRYKDGEEPEYTIETLVEALRNQGINV